MRLRTICVAVLATELALAVLAPPSGAQTTRTITVTPSTGLVSGDVVTITGSGFNPSATTGTCITLVDAGLCLGSLDLFDTDVNGGFSEQYTVPRFIFRGSAWIDCAAASSECVMAVGQSFDFAEVVTAPIHYAQGTGTPAPDMIFKRRSTGELFEDNQYSWRGFSPPRHGHAIAPGGTWGYALLVQNDGDGPDDLTITSFAALSSNSPFGLRFFIGYFDVTAAILGPGLKFQDVPPGGVVILAVQFRAAPTVNDGAFGAADVYVRSGIAPEFSDVARLSVTAT